MNNLQLRPSNTCDDRVPRYLVSDDGVRIKPVVLTYSEIYNYKFACAIPKIDVALDPLQQFLTGEVASLEDSLGIIQSELNTPKTPVCRERLLRDKVKVEGQIVQARFLLAKSLAGGFKDYDDQ